MKKLLSGFVILGGLLSLCGCSKLITSHQMVMQSFHTKEAVMKQFGLPDEKREGNGLTEWVYNCDSLSAFSRSKTRVILNGTYNTDLGVFNGRALTVTEFTPYDKYVKFTFVGQGKVLRWDSRGVNFVERKKRIVSTIALIAGSAIIIATIIYGSHSFSQLNSW